MKTIAIGADDAAYAFRDAIVAYLNGLGMKVADYSSDKRRQYGLSGCCSCGGDVDKAGRARSRHPDLRHRYWDEHCGE